MADLTLDGPRVIAMLNQKGGVGKTTSAVNVGAGLALEGQRVLLVDLDPQGHLTLHLGIDDDALEQTVYDLLIDPDCAADDVIIQSTRKQLDALLGEVDLAAAEQELQALPNRREVLRDKLAPVLGRYDVVLIDCPPSLGLLTMNALAIATEIIVPMQAHFLALQGVGRLLETVGLVSRSVNPELRVSGIILCMHERQTTLAKEIVADLDAFFEGARDSLVPWRDCQVMRPPIRRNIKLAEAPSFGQTIFDYAPFCAGAIDYRKLVRGMIERWKAAAGSRIAPRPEASAATTNHTANHAAPVTAAPATVETKPDAPAPAAPTGQSDAARADSRPDSREDAPTVEVVDGAVLRESPSGAP